MKIRFIVYTIIVGMVTILSLTGHVLTPAAASQVRTEYKGGWPLPYKYAHGALWFTPYGTQSSWIDSLRFRGSTAQSQYCWPGTPGSNDIDHWRVYRGRVYRVLPDDTWDLLYDSGTYPGGVRTNCWYTDPYAVEAHDPNVGSYYRIEIRHQFFHEYFNGTYDITSISWRVEGQSAN